MLLVRDHLIVCVTGGRDYQHRGFVFTQIGWLRAECRHMHVIEGGCPTGVDSFARLWAQRAMQRGEPVSHTMVKAHWHRYGKAAGPIRSREMLEENWPDVLMAFPGGDGTAACVNAAKALNDLHGKHWGRIDVRIITDKSRT